MIKRKNCGREERDIERKGLVNGAESLNGYPSSFSTERGSATLSSETLSAFTP